MNNADLSQPAGVGKLLAFMGAKGGAGTTTVALNVAGALAKLNRTVIAMELTSQRGTFSCQLQCSPAMTLGSLVAPGPEGIRIEEMVDRLCSLPCGFKVLFGPQNSGEFRDIGAGEAAALLREVSQLAQFIVIDLASQPLLMSRAVAGRCDSISMVLEPDQLSVACGKVQLELLNSWGVGQRVTGAIVVDRAGLLRPLSPSDISVQLNCPIVGLVPSAPEAMARANRAGSPIVFSEPENPAAVALAGIAAKVLTHAARTVTQGL